MKTSKITAVEFRKKLNFGNVYYITMSNEDEGEAIEQDEPKVGDEWSYDVELTQYGPKLKRPKPGKPGGYGGGKPGYQRESLEDKTVGMSYGYATQLVNAGKLDFDKLIPAANKLYDAMLATAKRGKP